MSEVQEHSTYHVPVGYYDNKITLLAKDPNWLYAYWEISDEKKNTFFNEFSKDIWEKSVPVLKIINVSKNYSFYVRINEFSNSWYVNVNESDSLYVAEIGRKVSNEFFVNLASSNYINTPGNTISSNEAAYFINYKDLKTGKLNLESKMIFDTFNTKTCINAMTGKSSLEFFGKNLEESIYGLSSANLYGINLLEHLGISSLQF